MKKALLFLISLLFAVFSHSQKLIDIYKNGPVKLIPENTYGSGNNWESLFNLYYDTAGTHGVYRELEKKIVLAHDGSIFMSHRNRYEIWKFGPDGNFLKKFGGRGAKQEQFSKMPLIYPVADKKYLIVCGDVDGKIKFFDLNGNFFKSITRNFTINNFQPINNGEVLYEGNILWKYDIPGTDKFTNKWRHIIVKLNIYTGEEKTIFAYLEDGDLIWKESGNIYSSQMISIPNKKIYLPNYFLFKKPVFTMLTTGNFLQSNRETGAVRMLNTEGKEISSFKLDIKPVAITKQDALDNYEGNRQYLLKTLDKAKAMPDLPEDRKEGTNVIQTRSYPDKKLMISRAEEALAKIDDLKKLDGYFPHLPYFSNIILDDEGNLLVFEFTSKEERNSNIFNVIAYDSNGQKLARTSFICDDYDLSFSESTFVISNGYVYAVARLKNTTGIPLRLAKFKMTN